MLTVLLALMLNTGALTASAAQPTLPVLERSVPAIYPADQLSSGEEAQVLLQLDIDETGAVIATAVVESAGPSFDAAALDAVRDFRFSPALDAQGKPAPARIQYRQLFSAQALAVISATGRVLGSEGPLSGVTLIATGPDGLERTATTDDDGQFSFAGLEDGTWSLATDIDGYEPQSADITVATGRVSEITLSPPPVQEQTEEADLLITISAPRREPEITERALTADEIRYLPGTGGDVVRAVQNLPGVARPPLNIGQLLIRGTAPEDSAYYVDGVRIPIVFHFAGLSTVVAGDSLEEVTFFPGNFGVRYGGILGGGVDLRFDPTLPEKTHGFASVDVYQAALFHEQKIGDNTALTISGRRSWIDAILNPILNKGAATIQAPRYYDGQLRLVHKTPDGGTLDALLFMSDDRFRVLGAEDDVVQIALVTHFQKMRLSYQRSLNSGWRAETTLLAGPEAEVFDLVGGQAYERGFSVGLRHEITRALNSGGRIRLGLDAEVRRDSLLYDVPVFGPVEQSVTWRVNPALYVEPTFAMGRLRLTPGLRMDPIIQDDGFGTIAVDPRLAARYDLGSTDLGSTELRASTGRFSQHPTTRQVAEIGGQSQLHPSTSWQSSVGVGQDLGPFLHLDAVAFYNRLSGLVVGREDTFRFFTGPPPTGPFDVGPYANDGTGDIYGAEFQLRLDTDSTSAWLAATFSHSTRVKRPGASKRLFAYDQPVVLTAVSTTELGRGWRVGGRLRYGTGNPYTPVVNRIYNLDKRSFSPVYGAADSDRLPGFFSLDVRVDKQWTFSRFDLSVYLDLQNATNTQNPEVMAWSPDYSEQTPISSLPTIPGLGLRVDW